jgi:UDP-glucose 4-epimerase
MVLSDAALPAATSLDDRGFNVGTGIETSVIRLADVLIRQSGREVPVRHADARPGELRHSSLDTTRLRSFGWAPASTLEDGLRTTYEYIRDRAAQPALTP